MKSIWYQEVIIMPTKNPRVNVVLEPEVYKALSILAKKEKVSLSTKTRELVKEAIETYEDIYWNEIAEEREKNPEAKKRISHKDVWK
jgi:predicted DNA-binding protein